MNKPIAILSGAFNSTLTWARAELNIHSCNISQKSLKDKDGKKYYIISKPEDMYGMEFSSYIKSPDYITLEDMIKSRIK